MSALRIETDGDGCRIGLRVRPGGRTSRVTGVYGDRLKVEVAEAPERGKANEAVLRLVAEALGVRRDAAELVAGAGSRDKVVRIAGLLPADALRRLERSVRE